MDDPLRMFLVVRRGAFTRLDRAAALGGAAAVACARTPAWAEAVAAWRPRPGKVCLRARTQAQWEQVLDEPHAAAGEPGGEAVVALPPRRRSDRGPLLERLQAMSSELAPLPDRATAAPVTFAVNPAITMSSGKTIAQVAHAAVTAADTGAVEHWVAAGCPAQVAAPPPSVFTALCRRDDLLARVEDAGLTEVPPGTVTVLALVGGLPTSV